jgi:hypothetical protein
MVVIFVGTEGEFFPFFSANQCSFSYTAEDAESEPWTFSELH